MVKRLYCLTIIVTLIFLSCTNSSLPLIGGEESEFGKYADSLNIDAQLSYLHTILSSDSSKSKSDIAVREYYDSLYSTGVVSGLWFSDKGISTEADEMLNFLSSELPNIGFKPSAFLVDAIERDLAMLRNLSLDSTHVDINEALVRLDYNLSKAYVHYTTGMRYGFVRPDKLLNKLYFRKERGSWAHLFDYDIVPPDYKLSVEKIATDDRMDYFRSSTPKASKVYEALKKEYLGVTDTTKRRKLLVSMERCRWSIRHPEQANRKILVNLPAQQLWTLSPSSHDSMRICCGAWETKTPLLCSEISYMQVNPEWSLPPKIVESDFARHVGDSAWFARHRYFVVDRKTGDTLNIASMGRSSLSNQRLRFVQRGGANNSLGRIVFRFPNNFSIYLHDTNTRGVFSRERRTVSHGCVRVAKPFELACFLLPDIDEWTRDRIRISMDIPPVTERGIKYLQKHTASPRPLRLLDYHGIKPKVPIYIVYFTAYPNPITGMVEYWPDFYGYDKPICRAMQHLLRN